MYNKLEITPTLHQYIFLTFPQWHQHAYLLTHDVKILLLKRTVEKYGGILGQKFREAVKYDNNHRKAFEYEKYLTVFDGSSFDKYVELYSRLELFTFSNKDLKFFLRLRLTGEEPIKELGIDLESIKEKLKRLKGLKCARERAEYLLKYLPEPKGDTDSFVKSLAKLVVVLIHTLG